MKKISSIYFNKNSNIKMIEFFNQINNINLMINSILEYHYKLINESLLFQISDNNKMKEKIFFRRINYKSSIQFYMKKNLKEYLERKEIELSNNNIIEILNKYYNDLKI